MAELGENPEAQEMQEVMESILEPLLDHLENFLSNNVQFYAHLDEEGQEDMVQLLQDALDNLVEIEASSYFDSSNSQQLSIVIECLQLLTYLLSENVTRRQMRRTVGRPRVEIDRDRLCYLIDNNFRVSDIALLYGCSGRTIRRRMAELQLNAYTSITDNDLDVLVKNIVTTHPQCGQNTINGRLRSYGIRHETLFTE